MPLVRSRELSGDSFPHGGLSLGRGDTQTPYGASAENGLLLNGWPREFSPAHVKPVKLH